MNRLLDLRTRSWGLRPVAAVLPPLRVIHLQAQACTLSSLLLDWFAAPMPAGGPRWRTTCGCATASCAASAASWRTSTASWRRAQPLASCQAAFRGGIAQAMEGVGACCKIQLSGMLPLVAGGDTHPHSLHPGGRPRLPRALAVRLGGCSSRGQNNNNQGGNGTATPAAALCSGKLPCRRTRRSPRQQLCPAASQPLSHPVPHLVPPRRTAA